MISSGSSDNESAFLEATPSGEGVFRRGFDGEGVAMMFLRPLTMPARSTRMVRRLLLIVLAGAVVVALAGAAPTFAASPWWQIGSETAPTNLAPGGEGQLFVIVSNLGDAPINASKSSVIITDKLPEGVSATAITGPIKNQTQVECTLAILQCTFAGILNPYEQITISIKVKIEEPQGTVSSLPDEASVQGGGAARVSRTLPVPVNGEAAPFGVSGFELAPFNEDGTPATLAGSHPFQLTTTVALNQTAQRYPVALPKDLHFSLPPGLVGNPNAATQCTMTDFSALVEETNLCPPSSVVGVATVVAHEPLASVITKTVPVFDLVPSQGEPARFGFEVIGKIPIVIDTSVRTGSDYGVVVSVNDATQTAGLLSSQVTLWGVPGDPRHDNARGWECVAGGAFAKQAGKPCPATSEVPQQPFLTLPTSCAANPAREPLSSSVQTDSWANPGSFLSAEYAWLSGTGQPLGFDGCNQLPFTPSIKVTPEVHSASTPTGLSVNVEVPQKTTLEANGLAEADVRDTTVTLPEGVELSPAAARGLEACSQAQIGYEGLNQRTQTEEFSAARPSCPEGSKVGLVHIKTPLLSHELEGAVYLATPAPKGAEEPGRNPFNSLVSLYIVAEDPVSGVLVKLAGKGELNESTLTVSTTFTNAPQVPFEDLKIELFGGPKGSVSTPAHCGDYGTDAAFTPWSGTGTVDLSSLAEEFKITSGAGGGGCPGSPLGFSPGFDARSTNVTAGAFTPFSLEIARPDGDQALTGITVHLPAGLAASLTSITPCQEPSHSYEKWTCGPESLIGQSTASSGLGSKPLTLGGEVYLTTGYDGAPFGLLVATEAKAGPFNLGIVDVRSRINVDPNTAAVTITSDPGPRNEAFPTQLRGIPAQLKQIDVSVDRPNFVFNPTNCSQLSIQGTLSGSEGASATVSSPFEVTGCADLPFKPVFRASTVGKVSKASGASLDVKVTSKAGPEPGGGEASIRSVKVDLPKQLPSRLTTIQKACPAATFEANPATCPTASDVGTATTSTPLLNVPLSGPAYLVGHGGEAFPNLELVLQGGGITLILDGNTDIKNGITSSTFKSVPDAPALRFELELPTGPYSILGANVPQGANYSLCGQTLTMPTAITGQNGAEIHETTKIAITGCKPAITVVRHSVKGETATVAVSVPAAGKLVATGSGLSATTGKAAGAGTVTVKLTLSKHEQTFLAEHADRELRVSIELTFTPKKGGRLKSSVTVLMA